MSNLNDVGVLDRSQYLGSSDIAAILGLSPWKSPVDTWFEKMGLPKPIDAAKEKLFKRGKRLEPIVLDMLEDEQNLTIVARGKRYRDPVHSWMAAEIDAEALVGDEHVNIEVKTVHPFAADQFGEENTDEIPIQYAAQATYGQMVTGRALTIFAVLVGADNLTVYRLERDEKTIVAIRQKAVAFWNEHVLAKVPPDPIVLDDVYRLLKRNVDVIAEAPDDIAQQIRDFDRAKQEARAANERADELKFQIGKWLLGAEAMESPTRKPKHVITSAGIPLLTIGYQEQSRIDSTMLRDRHPDIARECSKTSSFFRFDSPRKGKAR